jgi:4-diphosphocytidyl-2-C-methyl-D-erythritol kinase
MLVVPAHAKVNLALEVTGRRPDGWHDIATVIAALDWHDLVGIELRPRQQDEPPVSLRLTGPFAEGVPADATNLAHRAAARLFDAANPPTDLHLDVWVAKQVPVAAGMGGGSADAAAVLITGARILARHGTTLDPRQLTELAADLGSDVPALLAGGTLLATGRGERTQPISAPPMHLAVAVAGPSATAAAYAALTDAERHADGRAHRLATTLAQRQPPDDALLGSALEPAACRAAPGLADALHHLRSLTPGRRWHLTGSGGAAFALARDTRDAEALAAAAHHQGFPARPCRTLAR